MLLKSYTGGCCSNSKTRAYVGWRLQFTVHYGPTPPLLIPDAYKHVAVSGNMYANAAFWAQRCTSINPRAAFIVVAIGQVADYYRPLEGRSYCEMLQSSKLHEWSPDKGNVKV